MIKNFIFAEGTNVNLIASDKIPANNTSGVKGVSWNERDKKWAAIIGFQGKYYRLGYFDNKEDAVLARKMAEKKYFEPIIKKYMGTDGTTNSDSKREKT